MRYKTREKCLSLQAVASRPDVELLRAMRVCAGLSPLVTPMCMRLLPSSFRGHPVRIAGIAPAIPPPRTECVTCYAICGHVIFWSARRDLNPQLRPCKGRTLPLSYAPKCVSCWICTSPVSRTQQRTTCMPHTPWTQERRLSRNSVAFPPRCSQRGETRTPDNLYPKQVPWPLGDALSIQLFSAGCLSPAGHVQPCSGSGPRNGSRPHGRVVNDELSPTCLSILCVLLVIIADLVPTVTPAGFAPASSR